MVYTHVFNSRAGDYVLVIMNLYELLTIGSYTTRL